MEGASVKREREVEKSVSGGRERETKARASEWANGREIDRASGRETERASEGCSLG